MSDNVDLRNTQGGPDLDTVRTEHEGEDRNPDVTSGAPHPTQGSIPTGDDPHLAGAPDVSGGVDPVPLSERERQALEMQRRDPDGPSYEQGQDEGDTTGGSTDPANTRSFSDAGNESR